MLPLPVGIQRADPAEVVPSAPEAVRSCASLRLRPIQMFVQKLERAFAVDRVTAIEILDGGLVSQPQLGIEPPHLRVFVGYPLIPAYAIMMAALYHERPRDHQVGNLRVVECVPHVE